MVVERTRKDKQVELIKKAIQLYEMPQQETMQTVKERDIIVPDGKPDLSEVIYLDGEVNIDQLDVQEDRIVYKGQIDMTIVYQPTGEGAEVECMKSSMPIEDFIIIDGVDANQKVAMDYKIENLHWSMLNERKINVKAIVEAAVLAMKPKEELVVVGTEGDDKAQVQKVMMTSTYPARAGQDNLLVKDELTIMQDKECVSEILKMTPVIKEEQIKRTDTDILYNGIVEITTLYKSQDDDKSLDMVTHRVPFAGNIDLPKDEEEMYWSCTLEPRITYAQPQPDYDGEDRIIEMECMVNSKYQTYNQMEEEVVEDVYCPGKKMLMDKKATQYMTLMGREVNKMNKKDVVTMDGEAVDANKIFQSKVTPMVETKDVQSDKVMLSGMMEMQVAYLTGDPAQPIKVVIDMVPFTQEVSLKGLEKGQYIDVNLMAKDVNVTPYNKNDVMVEYTMESVVDAYQPQEMSAIDEMTVEVMDQETLNAYPSMTVYVVQKGDSLWEIAKRFNTTVEEIEAINDLEPHAIIYPMQKLIIIKKTQFE